MIMVDHSSMHTVDFRKVSSSMRWHASSPASVSSRVRTGTIPSASFPVTCATLAPLFGKRLTRSSAAQTRRASGSRFATHQSDCTVSVRAVAPLLVDPAGANSDHLAADPHGIKAPTVARQHSSLNDMTCAFGIEAGQERIRDQGRKMCTAVSMR
jgi:hypothetical protein